MAIADILLAIISTLVFIWDFLTWPIYQGIYKPWEKRKNFHKLRSRKVKFVFYLLFSCHFNCQHCYLRIFFNVKQTHKRHKLRINFFMNAFFDLQGNWRWNHIWISRKIQPTSSRTCQISNWNHGRRFKMDGQKIRKPVSSFSHLERQRFRESNISTKEIMIELLWRNIFSVRANAVNVFLYFLNCNLESQKDF